MALDFKAGYAIPVGNAENASVATGGAVPMSGAWSGAIPVELAARYLVTPNISLGVYFQYAPAFVASATCTSGASCTGYDMRTGLELVYGFLPDGPLRPWFSFGTGWEWTHYSVDTATQSSGVTWSGWEVVNVQTGLDFALGRAFALGPYVGYVGGIYSNIFAGGAAKGYGGAVDLSSRSFHGWFQVGLKGSLNL